MLAVAGLLAVLWGTLGALIRLVGRAAETWVARELARTRARRGDVTGLAEARAGAGRARVAWLRAVLSLAAWTGLLVGPALTPWPTTLYAASSLIWVLHWSRDRNR